MDEEEQRKKQRSPHCWVDRVGQANHRHRLRCRIGGQEHSGPGSEWTSQRGGYLLYWFERHSRREELWRKKLMLASIKIMYTYQVFHFLFFSATTFNVHLVSTCTWL